MMRVSYDAAADAFLLELDQETPVARTLAWGSGVTIELDATGRVLAVEVVEASRRFEPESLAALRPPVVRLSLSEAAQESGLSTETLRNQLNKGRLKGEKLGRDWTVSRAELLTYLESRAPSGKPPKNAQARRARARRGG